MIRKTALLITLAFLISAAMPSTASSENETSIIDSGENTQTKVRVETKSQQTQAVRQESRTRVSIESRGDATASIQIRDRSENEQMGQVAEQVQLLLANPERKGGIGEEVRQIAREQVHAQATISSQLQQLQSRNQLATRLFGPNYKAINALEGLMLQNQVRIQELAKLKTDGLNSGELEELEETIATLEDQNRSLGSQVATAKSTKSLFGWLLRLFVR